MLNPQVAVTIQFKTVLSLEQLREVAEERKKVLNTVPGLSRIFSHKSLNHSYFGCIYIFDTEENARNFLESFMIHGLGPKYGIIPDSFRTDVCEIMCENEFPFVMQNH